MTACLIVLWGVLGLLAWTTLFRSQRQRLRVELASRLVMRRSRIDARLGEELRKFDGTDPWGLLATAEAAMSRGDDATAWSMYQSAPQDRGRWEWLAARGMGRLALMRGRLNDAEQHLRRAIELNPEDLDSHDRLGHLLQLEGRTSDAAPHFFAQLIRGDFNGDQLLGAAGSDRFFRSDDNLVRIAKKLPTVEPGVQLLTARTRIADSEFVEAERLLREVTAHEPEWGDAQGRLGRLIAEQGDLAEFLVWRGGLPGAARLHPEVWYAQGLRARQDGQLAAAARCFLEAIERAPAHLISHLQLAACLHQLGEVEVAEKVRQHAELLSELDSVLNVLRSDVSPEFFEQAIDLLHQLGRHWEAAGWASRLRFLAEVPPEHAQQRLRTALSVARSTWDQQVVSHATSEWIDKRQYPLPQWSLLADSTIRRQVAPAAAVDWRFDNDAHRLGIDFTTTRDARGEPAGAYLQRDGRRDRRCRLRPRWLAGPVSRTGQQLAR
ncbi:MAG: tetratricopeptide repeat protein [Planctomycetaceae bacterium]